VLLGAGFRILAFSRLRTSHIAWAGSCRRPSHGSDPARGQDVRSNRRLPTPPGPYGESSTTPPAPGRVDTVPQEMLERLKIARHVAVEEHDADTRVDRKPADSQASMSAAAAASSRPCGPNARYHAIIAG